MAWPPAVLPINLTNATVQQDIHPQQHNAANQAINDLVATVKLLAPGFVGFAYIAAEQAAITTAWVNLTGVRVDYVDVAGRHYLALLQTQFRKAASDAAGNNSLRIQHSSAGLLGPASWTMAQSNSLDSGLFITTWNGTGAGPSFVQAMATTSNSYVNCGQSALLVVDLGPRN